MSWGVKKLGDVAPAKALKPKNLVLHDKVWHLNLDAIESHSGIVSQKVIAPISEASSSTHWFSEHHVLYSKLRPYLNKVVLPDTKGIATTELVPMLPKPDVLDRSYLAHYLRSERFLNWVNQQVAGAKMPRVSMKVFWDHEIPLPYIDNPTKSLAEQQRIAAILDKANSIRDKRQQAIELADKFLRDTFLTMFGDPIKNPHNWAKKKLGILCGIGSSRRVFKSQFVDTGIPFYRGTEIGKLAEGKNISTELFIPRSLYNELKQSSGIPARGDLLMPSICHDGRIWQVDNDIPFYFKDGRVLWVKNDQKYIRSSFLRIQLKYVFLSNYSNIASGTTFSELKIFNLKDLSVLTPPMEKQIKFGDIMETLSEKIRLHTRSLNDIELLASSLSQKAFKGEL